ncbi:MAG: V-type ATP synthase subunit E [Candidatus Heimdallarchaeaceae archaeon]
MVDKQKQKGEQSSTNLNNLLKKIISEAEDEAESLREEARKKLASFEKETKELVSEIKHKELEKELPHLEYIRKRTEAEYQQKAKRTNIQTKEKLIDEVFEKVEKDLSSFRNNSEYNNYLESKLESTQRAFQSKEMKLLIDKRDEKIIKQIINKLEKEKNVKFIIEITELETSGGFILTDKEERVRIDYTIEYLLEESKDTIRTKINEYLFN